MVSSQRDSAGKLIIDSIHGDIHLKEREVQVIDTASFQRLRQLKQLAMAQLVYPTATHTRFAHSIGALGTMIRILEAAEQNGIGMEDDEKDNLRLAALLHDIGHYPYSHLMEKLDKVMLIEEEVEGTAPAVQAIDAGRSKYPEHEEVGALIVTNQDDLIKAIGSKERAKCVADIFTRSDAADPQLSKLIHSSFDIDRWDYLLRDSCAAGVPYGQIDINYLLNNLKVSPQRMVGFSDKALPAVEHMLLARFFLYRVLYYHKTIYGLEEVCRQLLRRLRDRDGEKYDIPVDGEAVKKLITSTELHTFTDAFIDNIIQRAVDDEDDVVRALASSIQSRKPPSLLKEVVVCEETGKQYHAGNTFVQNCKAKLKRELVDKLHQKVQLKQFLLCEPKIPIVRPPERYTAAEMTAIEQEEIHDIAYGEEEEDIKIFVGDRTEPVSMMDVEHSMVAKYGNYSLQLFRLYVVYEGEDKNDVITQMRDTVKDWDKAR
jgi:HD superfamily phosphohydrolase